MEQFQHPDYIMKSNQKSYSNHNTARTFFFINLMLFAIVLSTSTAVQAQENVVDATHTCRPACTEGYACIEGNCIPATSYRPVNTSSAVVPAYTASSIPPGTPIYEHSTGRGGKITGGILLGVGVLNLATIPLCFSGVVADEEVCAVTSIIVGGSLVIVGSIVLIAGGVRMRRYKRWRKQNNALLDFSPWVNSTQGGLMWRVAF